MASPFKVFRKNAKVLLVGLFLLSMVSFVVIPSFLQWLETQRGDTVGVVVTTTKFGNLSYNQLESLHRARGIVRRFLEGLAQKIMQMGGNPLRVRFTLMGIEEPSEESLVRSWLIGQYARAAGLRMSDRSINAFIRGLIEASGVSISESDIVALLKDLNIGVNELFAALEQELLVLRYYQLAGVDLLNLQPGYTGETPGARWDYFLRFNRFAAIELCAIPVESYLEKVPTPDEQVARAFFEEHKDRLPDPLSPEPGFRVPAKVTLEYLKADLQEWLLNTKVSDEELLKVYNERKDEMFLRPTPPPQSVTSPSQSAPASQTEQGGQGPVGGTSPGPEISPPAQEPSQQMDAPAKTEDQGTSQPLDNPQSTPANPGPAGENPPASPGSESGGAPQSSSGQVSHRVLLAAYAEEARFDKENSSKEETASQTETAPSGEAPAGQAAEIQPGVPSGGQTETSAGAGEAEKPGQQQAPVPAETQPAGQPVAQPTTTQESSKYRPFEEVKEEVKSLIVNERIKAVLDEVEEIMRQYQGDLANYEAAKEEAERTGQTPPPAPTRPDLQKIAKEKGLDYFLVEDAPVWELAKRDIGEAIDFQGASFVRGVFEVAKFLSLRALDLEGNQYVAWVTDRVSEHVPRWDEPGIKETVIRTWRIQEARKLAEKEGRQLVERINASGQTLAECLKTLKSGEISVPLPEPVETEPFTWLTYGELEMHRLTRSAPRISPVKVRVKDPASGLFVDKDAVENIGNEFMAAVFSLGVGQAGLAWNQPQTVMCIVRLKELQPPAEQLFERFVRDSDGTYIQAVQFDLGEMIRRWARGLERDAGLKWVRAQMPGQSSS